MLQAQFTELAASPSGNLRNGPRHQSNELFSNLKRKSGRFEATFCLYEGFPFEPFHTHHAGGWLYIGIPVSADSVIAASRMLRATSSAESGLGIGWSGFGRGPSPGFSIRAFLMELVDVAPG